MNHKLYSAPDLASLLGIQLDTLYRYARKGKIRGLKIGKEWRFTEADVQEFLQSHRYAAPAQEADARLLTEALRQAANRAGSPSGVIFRGSRTSYRDIDRLSDRLAEVLQESGIRAGDRVAMLLPNSVEFVIGCFAVWKVRGILVAEDAAIRLDNLHHILKDSRPAALIVDRTVAEQIEGMQNELSQLRVAIIKDHTFSLSGMDETVVESLDAILESKTDGDLFRFPAGQPDEVVSLTYTSGSTGPPKGVMHTHRSWLASAAFTRDYPGVTAKDTIVIPLPLHHGLAFRQMLGYLLANATIVIATDIYQALKVVREQKPTALVLVPAAVNILIDHFASVLREADSFLRYIEVGSAALAPERLQRLRELLPTTPVHLPYGLNEGRVGFLKPGADGLLNRIATVAPGLEVQVVDGLGQLVAKGQSGEILLRGEGLMKGYWGQSEGEQEVLKRDGFRTGDAGMVDDMGEVVLVGRLDNVLKVGGHKVNPVEVEMVLNRHPSVAESAVVGIPDPKGVFENELHAFIVPKRNKDLDAKELLVHCRQYLESYKIPMRTHFRTSLPKSSVGKILRHALVADGP